MSLADMSKYFLYLGIAMPIVMGIFFYCIFKNNGSKNADIPAVKSYLNMEKQGGEIFSSQLVACRQTNVRYGNDFSSTSTSISPAIAGSIPPRRWLNRARCTC